MKIDEIPPGLRYQYISSCSCTKEYIVLTQKNDFPEYETEIFIKCDCGEFVFFKLPVN